VFGVQAMSDVSSLMMGNNLKISRNNTHKLQCLVLTIVVEALHVRDQ